MLAHKASHEGRTAVEAIAGHKVAFEPAAIPAVVFTDPEIAWCGLRKLRPRRKTAIVKVAKFPWAASGRAMTLDRTEGMTKLIIDPQTERVLGSRDRGRGAGELIAEGVLAVEMAASPRTSLSRFTRIPRCRRRSWNRPRFSSAPAPTSTGRKEVRRCVGASTRSCGSAIDEARARHATVE